MMETGTGHNICLTYDCKKYCIILKMNEAAGK